MTTDQRSDAVEPAAVGSARCQRSRFRSRLRWRQRRAWWWELALVVVLYAGYDAVRGVIRADAPEAVRNGAALLHWEHLFGFDIEHPVNNVLEHAVPLAVAACFFYATAHFLVTPTVLVWMWLRRPAAYRATRTVLASVTVLALIGFWLLPTAPPRLLPGSGFHDTLADYRNWGWWGAADSAPRPLAALANQFAAFPSLHVAWALWCGVTLWRHARGSLIRALGALYPVVTALVVLGTANHYVLDVAAGVALWWICDRATSKVHRVLARRRRPAHPAPASTPGS